MLGKSKKLFFIICLFLFLQIPKVWGNFSPWIRIPIGPDPDYVKLIPIMILANIIIEPTLLILFFRKKINSLRKFYLHAININLLTFPITQVIILCFFRIIPPYILYIPAELFPILLEYIYFLIYLRERKSLKKDTRIYSLRIFASVVIVNLVSFGFGLLYQLPFILNYFVEVYLL